MLADVLFQTFVQGPALWTTPALSKRQLILGCGGSQLTRAGSPERRQQELCMLVILQVCTARIMAKRLHTCHVSKTPLRTHCAVLVCDKRWSTCSFKA